MFKNYITIAWRNLFRNTGFSLINLLGLTMGITCAVFILLWVQNELSYNKEQRNYSSIYQVMANRNFNNQISTDDAMPFPLPKAIESRLPQVKYAVLASYPNPSVLSYGGKKLKKTGQMVSEHYFNIFSWKFLQGNAATAINNPDAMVLTESAARTLFGNENPVNKQVRMDNNRSMRVSAVIQDIPANSSLQFDFVIPVNYSDPFIQQNLNDWVQSFSRVYVQLQENTDPAKTGKNITDLIRQNSKNNDTHGDFFIHPISKWRLYSDFKDGKNTGGMIEYVRLFSVIAVIILFIACVNFMNLSTARSEKRAKEVGIRKTLGSSYQQLMLLFFFESIILTFIAFAISIGLVYLLLPLFNNLVDKQLALQPGKFEFWIVSVIIILFTGLLAGSYPALYLSSFNPVKVLKGTFIANKSVVAPRRVLVVVQFVISILLITSTLIIYKQLQHVKKRDLGYNPDNLVMVPSSEDVTRNYQVIKNSLLKTGLIDAVTATSSAVTEIENYTPAPEWSGKPANETLVFSSMSTVDDYTKTTGTRIIAGRDFENLPTDTASVMLNEAAVKMMKLKEPIGTPLNYFGRKLTLTGVVANMVMASPYKPVEPMVIFYRPQRIGFVNIRLNRNVQPQQALKAIESIFKQYNPAYPFEYQFADQEFGKKFLTENLIGKLTNIFAGLAILICSLGLAGLASFTIEKRFREIGIRKVLGASVQQIIFLISKEFLKLVLIAFVIAVPITWWAMHNWLDHYAYRINISAWYFAAVGAGVLLITLVIISFQSVKAALANPVKSLRSE